MKPEKRLRDYGGGRSGECPEIGAEVWRAFCRRLQTNRSRVGMVEMMEMGNDCKEGLRKFYAQEVRAGRLLPSDLPSLPTISRKWVDKWRRYYGVSWRTINVRYKISRKKLLSRLRTFWCNVIRVRYLCQLLTGTEPTFVGYDQKASWFNFIGQEKTMAPKGTKKVGPPPR